LHSKSLINTATCLHKRKMLQVLPRFSYLIIHNTCGTFPHFTMSRTRDYQLETTKWIIIHSTVKSGFLNVHSPSWHPQSHQHLNISLKVVKQGFNLSLHLKLKVDLDCYNYSTYLEGHRLESKWGTGWANVTLLSSVPGEKRGDNALK
jgi:hypothetical protein